MSAINTFKNNFWAFLKMKNLKNLKTVKQNPSFWDIPSLDGKFVSVVTVNDWLVDLFV